MAGAEPTGISPLAPTPGLFTRLFKNPIMLRELRIGGRSNRMLVAHAISLVVQAFAMMVVLLTNSGEGGSPQDFGTYAFITQAVIMLVIVCVVFPAFSCTSIVSERDDGCLDLLLLSHVEAWEIVWGKLAAAVLHSSLFTLSSLPIFVIAVSYGGFPPGALLLLMLAMIPVSVLLSAWGIYTSAIVKKPIAAMAGTYLISFGLGFVLFAIGWMLIFEWLGFQLGITAWLWDGNAFDRTLVIVSVMGGLLLNAALLVAGTIARLQPEGADKATALRLLSVVATGFGIIILVATLPSVERLPAAAIPGAVSFVMTLLALMAVAPAIKVTGEAAFAPRGVARRIAAMREPMRTFRWLIGPGSAPALLLGALLVTLTLGTASVVSASMFSSKAKSAPVGELSEGLSSAASRRTRLAINAGLAKVNSAAMASSAPSVANPPRGGASGEAKPEAGTTDPQSGATTTGAGDALTSGSKPPPPPGATVEDGIREAYASTGAGEALTSGSEPPPPPGAAIEDGIREAYSALGGIGWRFLLYSLVVLGAFGGVAWWASYLSTGTKLASVWGYIALVASMVLPLIVGPAMLAQTGMDVQSLSPIVGWQSVYDLGVLSAAESMNSGAEYQLAHSRAWQDLSVSVAMLLGVMAVASFAALWMRRRALIRREAAGGRWPVPRIPPPRGFVASKQTALAAQIPTAPASPK